MFPKMAVEGRLRKLGGILLYTALMQARNVIQEPLSPNVTLPTCLMSLFGVCTVALAVLFKLQILTGLNLFLFPKIPDKFLKK
jgi:hypothetical protein